MSASRMREINDVNFNQSCHSKLVTSHFILKNVMYFVKHKHMEIVNLRINNV